MRVYDMVELAGRNLREAVLRNSLTTMGIGVGVASLVAFLSLGAGLQKLATRQLGRSGLFDSIVVTPRHYEPPHVGQNGVTRSGPPKSLDDDARRSLERIPEVAEVYSNFSAVGEFRLDGAPSDDGHFTVAGGLPESARDSEAFDDFQGRFFSSGDAHEVILYAGFARTLLGLPEKGRLADPKLTPEEASRLLGRELVFRYAQKQAQAAPATASSADAAQNGDPPGEEADPLGFNVVRKEQRLKIVGIVNTEPNRGLRRGRTSVFLPIAYAESLNVMQRGDLSSVMRPGEGRTYSALVVRVEKSRQVRQVEKEIRKLGFDTFSIVDASRGITKFFTILYLFLGIFGSLALAVAFLGIVNTLVMAILERRREIGIMKALGASDGDVKRIFFVEAGVMGALGGTLGVGLGWLMGRIINFGTNIYLKHQAIRPENFWYVPMWLVVFAIVFSVLVSLFAGLYPASRAARLDPVQTLRHD